MTDEQDWFTNLIDSMSPPAQRNFERYRHVVHIQINMNKIFFWMRWPLLNIIYVFWGGLIEEGIKNTIKPRWGRMTWVYLNDGMGHTVWHTLMCIFRPNSKYATTLYPKGAPRGRKEADIDTYPEILPH